MRARDLGLGAFAGGLALIAGQVAYAGHRKLPEGPDLDPSGSFGDPSLPLLRIGLLGDSVMTAQGLDHVEHSWARLMVAHLSDRYRVVVLSYAMGGARTGDVLHRQVPRAETTTHDIIIISAGGNDILRAKPVWKVEKNLDESVARLKAVARSIILFGVGDLGSIPRLPYPTDRLAAASGHVADRIHQRVANRHNIAKVDQWSLTTDAFNSGRHMFGPDLFHPSPAGHRAWAEAVIPTVEEELLRLEIAGDRLSRSGIS